MLMKRILMMFLLVVIALTANAQWKVGIVKKDLNNMETDLDTGDRIGYIKNRDGSYTLYESIRYEGQLNEVGNCSEQYFRSHVRTTDFFYGQMTDPKDDYVNIRKGPGTNYPVVYKAELGTGNSCILFKKTGSNWYEVYGPRDYAKYGRSGWGILTSFNEDEYNLNKMIKIGYIYKDRIKTPDYYSRVGW